MNIIPTMLQDQFGPLILQLLGAIFTALAIVALNALRKYIGEKNTRAFVELLHKALDSGVKSQMADGETTPNLIAKAAVEYAKKSIPDTLNKMRPSYEVMIDIAKSKIIDVLASGAKK